MVKYTSISGHIASTAGAESKRASRRLQNDRPAHSINMKRATSSGCTFTIETSALNKRKNSHD